MVAWGGKGGIWALGSLDKRHFVGVRFVLSNTHVFLSLGSLLSALIKQSLIWVPSPVPGKKKEACYFEESQVNNTDKRFRHKKEGEKKQGRVRVKNHKEPYSLPVFWLQQLSHYGRIWIEFFSTRRLECLCLSISQLLWILPYAASPS